MAYVVSKAQVAPYIPVQHRLFKDAFVVNYRKARWLQRDSVFWFTSSRNYRLLTAIAVAACLVLGAAICQLKAIDYSTLTVHRTGANFIWSITSFVFCALEFSRIFRRRDGYWTWETGCAIWLAVSIVISGLAVANNVVGTMDLSPGIYRTEQTTRWPFYYGMTTPRFPPETTTNKGTTLFRAMTTGLTMNEWDTYQWSNWRKAVFVLYCFCTITQGCVLLFCYLPYVFFKIHEYKLGYGRRLLSNGQIYDVTKNAVQAYKAAVYNRDRLQQVLDDRMMMAPSSFGGSVLSPGPDMMPPPDDDMIKYPGMSAMPPEHFTPRPPSTVSSGNFKHACQKVKPLKSAWFPVFEAPPAETHMPFSGGGGRASSTYYSYDDDSYYGSYSATPSYTSSYYYYNYSTNPNNNNGRGLRGAASNTTGSYYSSTSDYSSSSPYQEPGEPGRSSASSTSSSSQQQRNTSSSSSHSRRPGRNQAEHRRPRLVQQQQQGAGTSYDEDAETFTEYIPVGGGTTTENNYTSQRTSGSNSSSTTTTSSSSEEQSAPTRATSSAGNNSATSSSSSSSTSSSTSRTSAANNNRRR